MSDPTEALPDEASSFLLRRREQDQPPDITPEMIRRARAGYWGLVETMDSMVGEVLDCLIRLGVLDDFFVMYSSDHGEMAGERGLWQKSTFYEQSVRTPMILAGPDLPRGRRVTSNTSHLDIMPTLCELAGIEPPAGGEGRSMLPLLSGPSAELDRIILSEHNALAGTDHSAYSAVTIDQVMAKQRDLKLIDYDGQTWQAFDLSRDPLERQNVADDPKYCKALRVLRDEIERFRGGSPIR